MNAIMIKKVGNGFEVSNGKIAITGDNRAELIEIMDSLEKKPANIEQLNEKVKVAAKAVKKKVAEKKKSGVQLVRDFMNSSKGEKSIAEVAEATGLSRKYAANYLWNLWKAREINSTNVGIYFK